MAADRIRNWLYRGSTPEDQAAWYEAVSDFHQAVASLKRALRDLGSALVGR